MKKCALPGYVIVLSTVATWLPAAPPDWPQWMGPNRDSLSTESSLLQSWPAGGPALAWKAVGLGDGYSTVSVVGERIFTMGEKGDQNYVIALNRADGRKLWSAKVGKAGAPGWGGFKGPRVTPTIDNDLLFAVGQYGEVVCLGSATGKEIWRKDYSGDFGGKLPEWGFSASPLVDGDQVILAPGGTQGNLVALNKKSGSLIWQSKSFVDSIHYSSPIVVELDGVRQYIQLTDASVAGVAADDGAVLWKTPRRGRTAVIPTPIHADNHVYVSSGYGAGCNLFRINASSGNFEIEEVYANKVMVNHHGGVLKLGDYLYGYSDGKGWTCQSFASGEVVWQEKQALGKGSICYADRRLYLREEDGKGTVALIEASPDGYKEHGRFAPPDRSNKNSWPHPVVADGKLYLRDQDVLLCYEVTAK